MALKTTKDVYEDQKKKKNLVQNQSIDLLNPQTPFTDAVNNQTGQSTQPTTPPTTPPNQTPEVYRDPQTGKITAVLSNGKFLPFGDDQEARDYLARQEQIQATPEGAVEVATARANEAEIKRKLETAKQVGKIDFATAQQLEEQGIDVKQAIAAGLGQAVPTALGYGATAAGATLVTGAGAPAAPAVGAVGAAVGAVKGFYSGVTGNIKAQRTDLATVKTKELKKRTTAINNYISAANANPANADEYVAAMNTELSLIRKDYNTLSKRGNEDLRFWGSDATPQLVEYEIFFEATQPSLELKMIQAVSKPDPTRAYIDVGTEGTEE